MNRAQKGTLLACSLFVVMGFLALGFVLTMPPSVAQMPMAAQESAK